MADFFDSEIYHSQQRQVRIDLGLEEPEAGEAEYAIYVPGVTDVIHLLPRAKITPEEMAAHRAALRRKELSPLTPRQLQYLRWRRDVYLKIRQSATPEEVRQVGWYLNQVENVGDMMTAAYWGGKGIITLLQKIGLRARGPAAKYVGWALTAKDIADTVNMFKAARTLRGMKKGSTMGKTSMNPFSTQSKLNRGFKLLRRMPGIPDWIEIVQVTDQFFGVGVSFGAIVGFAYDVLFGVRKGAKWMIPPATGYDQRQLCLEGFSSGCGLQLEGP